MLYNFTWWDTHTQSHQHSPPNSKNFYKLHGALGMTVKWGHSTWKEASIGVSFCLSCWHHRSFSFHSPLLSSLLMYFQTYIHKNPRRRTSLTSPCLDFSSDRNMDILYSNLKLCSYLSSMSSITQSHLFQLLSDTTLKLLIWPKR